MFTGKLKIASFILLATALSSCQRPLKDASQLKVRLPSNLTNPNGKIGALALTANDKLSHLALNITGSGMSPIIYGWDGCEGCVNPPSPPSTISFDVPSGSGRLVQVLAVYKNSSSNMMSFYYGDQVADLNSAEMSIGVTVYQVGSGAVISGGVSGRYMTAANTGPTGLVDIRYVPPNGRPAMLVDYASIYSGWFRFFMLSGANLTYTVRDTGLALWGGPVSLDSASFTPSNSVLKMAIPVHMAKWDNSATTYSADQANIYAWGFWGDPTSISGKKVCTSSFSGTFTKYKGYGNPSTPPSLTLTDINSSGTFDTNAAMLDTASPLNNAKFKGGTTGCTAFSPDYVIPMSAVDGNGGDRTSVFFGALQPVNNNPVTVTTSSGYKVISGTVLPGFQNAADTFRLFKKTFISGSDNYHMSTVDCAQLGLSDFQFTFDSDAAIDGAGAFTLNTNIANADANFTRAVLCPMKAGKYVAGGIFLGGETFGYSGGNSAPQTATTMALVYDGSKIGNNICTPVTVEGRAGSSTAYFPNGTNLTFTTNISGLSFYTDDYCSMNLVSDNTNGWDRYHLYVKRANGSTPTASTGTITVTADTAVATLNGSVSFDDPPGSNSSEVIKINVQNSIGKYECNEIEYVTMTNSPNPMVMALSTYYGFSFPSTPGLNFYNNGDCSGTPLSGPSFSTHVSQRYYFSYTGGLSQLNDLKLLTPSPTYYTSAFSGAGASPITVENPGPAAMVSFYPPSNAEVGECIYLNIRLQDSNWRLAAPASSVTLNLAASGVTGAFYPTSACTGAPISTVGYTTSQAQQVVYFKSTDVGTANITVSDQASNLTSAQQSLSFSPETFSQLLVVSPGVTYTGSGTTGSPYPVAQGGSLSVAIYAVKQDGSVDTSFNGTLSNLSISGTTSTPSPASITFSSGVASMNLTAAVTGTSGNIYINLNADRANGMQAFATLNIPTFVPANALNLYMSQTTVYLDSCQIFAVIPENGDMAAPAASSGSYTVNITHNSGATGSVYSDPSCSSVVSGPITWNPNDRIHALFYKTTGYPSNETIAVTPSIPGVSSGATITVSSTSGNTGTMANFMFTGRFSPMKANQCQPYLISMADSGGRSVNNPGGAISMTLTVSSGGGTVGTFDDIACGGDGTYNPPTSIAQGAGYNVVFMTAMIGGSVHILQVSGGYSKYTTPTVTPY